MITLDRLQAVPDSQERLRAAFVEPLGGRRVADALSGHDRLVRSLSSMLAAADLSGTKRFAQIMRSRDLAVGPFVPAAFAATVRNLPKTPFGLAGSIDRLGIRDVAATLGRGTTLPGYGARFHARGTLSLRLPANMLGSADARMLGRSLGVVLDVARLHEAWRLQGSQLRALLDRSRVFSDLAAGVDFEQIFRPYARYLSALPTLDWLLAQELEHRGWWLVPSFDRELRAELARTMARGGGIRKVTAVIADHYEWNRARRLSRMVKAWEDLPEFTCNGRKTLYRQLLRSFRRGDYAAAIGGLNGLFEGISKDFLFNEGLINDRVRRSPTSPVGLLGKHVRASGHYLSGFVAEMRHLFSSYAGPKGRRRRVNRHGQSHGGEVPPNSAAAFIRGMLLLETLHFHLSRARAASRRKTPP